jgi:hypothetical protein
VLCGRVHRYSLRRVEVRLASSGFLQIVNELASRIIDQDRMQAAIAHIYIAFVVSGDTQGKAQAIAPSEKRIFRINEVENMHRSSPDVRNENAMVGICRHTVRLLQGVDGELCVLGTGDYIKCSIHNGVLPLDILGRGKLAYKTQVFRRFVVQVLRPGVRRRTPGH